MRVSSVAMCASPLQVGRFVPQNEYGGLPGVRHTTVMSERTCPHMAVNAGPGAEGIRL